MKIGFGWLSVLLLAGILTAIPGHSEDKLKFEKAYKKMENVRTWVV